jgi:hypothetical protein
MQRTSNFNEALRLDKDLFLIKMKKSCLDTITIVFTKKMYNYSMNRNCSITKTHWSWKCHLSNSKKGALKNLWPLIDWQHHSRNYSLFLLFSHVTIILESRLFHTFFTAKTKSTSSEARVLLLSNNNYKFRLVSFVLKKGNF